MNRANSFQYLYAIVNRNPNTVADISTSYGHRVTHQRHDSRLANKQIV